MTTGSEARALVPDDDGTEGQRARDESLVQFIRANEMQIKKFLQRTCDDSGLVEDACQEALIVTSAKWDVVSTHDQPIFWVRKVAYFKLMKLLGSRREVVGLEGVGHPLSADPSNEWEAESMLMQLLRQLPTRQRAAIALAADGCNEKEICQQLGLAQSTVRTYITAARSRLKDLAAKAGYDAATRRRV